MPDESRIDTSEEFPHLTRAPIVEAALEIRARAEATWEEQAILNQLKAELPEYPNALSQREIRHELKMGPGPSTESKLQDLGMKGFRFESSDKAQIAQFNRDGFVFSRLPPYEGWVKFSEESFRLWEMYSRLARPTQIQRLGLRFINRLPLIPQHDTPGYYLVAPPQTSKDLDFPLVGFLHRDSFGVSGHPYIVNLVKTAQPQQSPSGVGPALILDIDVVSDQPFPLAEGELARRVVEMRWLKNKFFFGNITQELLETFK
jgi:uncharacterized protein (TIGR04255 family)